jgi:hypothetical protein
MEKRHGAAKVMGSMPPPEKLPQSEGVVRGSNEAIERIFQGMRSLKHQE